MLTITKTFSGDRIEGACIAADTKPTNVGNGSILIEMDTGKTYMFDKANTQWREV